MISVALADRLRSSGMGWRPAPGDRFVVPGRDLDDQVFVISEMTIEPQEAESGGVVRFNGTTEWALDSIEQSEVVWLPHESQLRAMLGDSFLRLERLPDGFAVELRESGGGTTGETVRHVDQDAECAYARAVLEILTGASGPHAAGT